MTGPAADQHEESAEFRADLAVIASALQEGRKSKSYDARFLREAVRSCAVHARLNRYPPEKLVRALKALVREVSLDDPTDAYRTVYTDRVIGWAIEGFYELNDR